MKSQNDIAQPTKGMSPRVSPITDYYAPPAEQSAWDGVRNRRMNPDGSMVVTKKPGRFPNVF